MRIADLAVERSTTTAVVLLFLLGGGVWAYLGLPRAEFPDFTIRTAVVATFHPGAAPEEVERLVTEPLEEAAQAIGEVERVESESRRGVSIVRVHLDHSRGEPGPVWDDLRHRLQDLRPELPEGVVGPVVNDRFGDVFGIVIAVTGAGRSPSELHDTARELERTVSRLPDVAEVAITGVRGERIWVEYDEATLAAHGLTPARIARTLGDENAVRPGGFIRTDRERIEVEPSGPFRSVEELRRATLVLPGGDLAALEDVAEVRRGHEDPPQRLTTFSGEPALAVAISMRDGGQITTLGPRVIEEVESLRSRVPPGIDFHAVTYEPAVVEAAQREFVLSLAQAILMVVAVILLFLGWRSGFVTATVIPLSVMGALVVMYFLGVGLTRISIAALIISLGLLVDCAIVVAEGVRWRMTRGEAPREAALASVREHGGPLLTSMLATAAALLPIPLARHAVGEMMAPLFLVVTTAILLSWLLSMTAIPALAVRFMAPAARSAAPPRRMAAFEDRYRRALRALLRRRGLTLGSALVLLAGGVLLVRTAPQEFFPRSQEATFTAIVELPPGTSFERTREVVTEAEEYMRRELMAVPIGSDGGWAAGGWSGSSPGAPRGARRGAGSGEASAVIAAFDSDRRWETGGIVNWAGFIGSGAPRFNLSYAPEQPRAEYAILKVNTTSWEKQQEVMVALRDFLVRRAPDAIVRVAGIRRGPPVEYPVQIRVSGPDRGELLVRADSIRDRLDRIPGTINVSHDWGLLRKRLDVEVDPHLARRAGLTPAEVAVSLQGRLGGFPLTTYREGPDLIPVLLRARTDELATPEDPEQILLRGEAAPHGIPLDQAAGTRLAFEPARILRYDRERTVTVRADLDPAAGAAVTPFSVTDQLDGWLAPRAEEWPVGYRYAYGGEVETSNEARGAIAAGLPVAAVLVLLLLVIQFDSVRKPAVVVLALPFALVGVGIGLRFTGAPFSFMAILGVIGLLGIVINQTVVLVRRIAGEVEVGDGDPASALVEATLRRVPPILMATLTTVAGVLALWLNGEPMFVPLAVAMVFGLLASLAITLGIVPVLYAVLHGIRVD